MALSLVSDVAIANPMLMPGSVSAYIDISCTDSIEIALPAASYIRIPNGYNPAGRMAPGATALGELAMTGKWFPDVPGIESVFNGQLCVARLVTKDEDGIVLATRFCGYYTPVIKVNHPEGDGVSTFSMSGSFNIFSEQDAAAVSNSLILRDALTGVTYTFTVEDGMLGSATGGTPASDRLVLIDTVTGLPVTFQMIDGQLTKL